MRIYLMALIVEDGTGVANADSYISLADARTRAVILGVSLNATDGTAEQQLQQATLYIDREYRDNFQGTKMSRDQALQWPRTPVLIDDYMLDSDSIPQELVDAQIYAAAQLEAGNSFYSNNDGKSVKMEEVTGAVKVEYFNTGKTGTQVRFSDVQNAINPLLDGNSGRYSYKVRR